TRRSPGSPPTHRSRTCSSPARAAATRRSSRAHATASPRTGSRTRTTRSASTTRAARRGSRRASCTRTAAHISTRSPRRSTLAWPVLVTTAAAPPPPAVIERTEALGFEVNHVYGLTETYGPITLCEWNPAWDGEGVEERARLKARQGIALVTSDAVRVVDAEL